MFKEFYILLFQVLLILNIIFTITVILYEKKNPGVTWAWIMIVIFIPFIGFITYLLFGLDGKKYNDFAKKYKYDKEILNQYSQLQNNIQGKNSNNLNNIEFKHLKNIINLNLKLSGSEITYDNNISIYHEGQNKFEDLIKDINNAKHYIHIQYYIIKNDELGRRIINLLAKKASLNVEVKLLIDGMGSKFISKRILKPLISAGGKVEIFMPPNIIKINFRNHRKVCIIDGKIGYIGGFNIGNEYLGKVKKFGNWRDCHLRLEGSATKDLQKRFIMDWNYSSQNAKIKIDKFYFPVIYNTSGSCVQIVSSGPDTKWPSIQYAYINMISKARKSIYIQTPYFIPDESIYELLRVAALSGIDVKIMIPAYPDHPFVYWAALSYLGELINCGVKCYKYEDGFVHSKIVIIDNEIASVGSANMDIRSLKLNFEINAFIYSKKEVEILKNKFILDIYDSSIIDYNWYKKLSCLEKIKESLCRLISPLL